MHAAAQRSLPCHDRGRIGNRVGTACQRFSWCRTGFGVSPVSPRQARRSPERSAPSPAMKTPAGRGAPAPGGRAQRRLRRSRDHVPRHESSRAGPAVFDRAFFSVISLFLGDLCVQCQRSGGTRPTGYGIRGPVASARPARSSCRTAAADATRRSPRKKRSQRSKISSVTAAPGCPRVIAQHPAIAETCRRGEPVPRSDRRPRPAHPVGGCVRRGRR